MLAITNNGILMTQISCFMGIWKVSDILYHLNLKNQHHSRDGEKIVCFRLNIVDLLVAFL